MGVGGYMSDKGHDYFTYDEAYEDYTDVFLPTGFLARQRLKDRRALEIEKEMLKKQKNSYEVEKLLSEIKKDHD